MAEIDKGDTAFMLLSSALVFVMTFPGLALFYGGLARSRDVMSMFMLCLISMVVVTVQWYLFGFSLALSTGSPADATAASSSANPFIGDFKWTAMHNAMDNIAHPLAPTIPMSVFSAYHQQLAIITPAIAIGAGASRGRLLPAAVFIFLWTTLVYDILIYWVWAPNGWLHTLDGVGIYDYAGGIPVHLACGVSAAAYALALKRRKPHKTPELEPHSPMLVYIGTGLVWFGWAVGFNGGGAYAANARAASATFSSNLSAAVGALTWSAFDYRRTGKLSSVAMCTGAIAGLASITAGCGFVSVPASMIFGFVGSFCSYLVFSWKSKLGFDDPMDVFVIHGVDGCVGILLTGLFAQRSIIGLDGTALPATDGTAPYGNIGGGWLDHNYRQLGVQLAGVLAGGGWAFVISYLLLRIMDAIPFLRLRVSEEEEAAGIDKCDMGEDAYAYIPLVLQSSGDLSSAAPLKHHPGAAAANGHAAPHETRVLLAAEPEASTKQDRQDKQDKQDKQPTPQQQKPSIVSSAPAEDLELKTI